jgi:hypothetical protein
MFRIWSAFFHIINTTYLFYPHCVIYKMYNTTFS